MKIKKGFTLAEVLVTLTIVGITAALTIPQISKNLQKSQAGPTLARAVQSIELGCQELLQDASSKSYEGRIFTNFEEITFKDIGINNSKKLFDSDYNENFGKVLAAYMGATPKTIDWANVPDLKSFNNTSGDIDLVSTIESSPIYKLNSIPAEISIGSSTSEKTIIIDVNGWGNAPNTFGKDIFGFILKKDNNRLIPHTSEDLEHTQQVVKDSYKIKYY